MSRQPSSKATTTRRLSQACPLFCCVTFSDGPQRAARVRCYTAKKEAGEEESEKKYAAKFRKTPPPQAFFQLYDEEDAELGARPGSVFDLVPQGRVVRHVVEHRIETCPFQILDAPVPQMGDQVFELLQKIVLSLVESVQVLAVPKISFDRVPKRSAARSPQTAEQLVEVPTERGYVIAIIATQALGWRGARALAGQLVATPVPQGRQGGRGGLHDSRAGQGCPAAVVKQIVDIPVPQGRRVRRRRSLRFTPWTEFNSGCGADR